MWLCVAVSAFWLESCSAPWEKEVKAFPQRNLQFPVFKVYFVNDNKLNGSNLKWAAAFLQKEYAEENLDFVLRVERYRESLPKKREREAWKIYRTYIAIGAPHELNLDILSRKVS